MLVMSGLIDSQEGAQSSVSLYQNQTEAEGEEWLLSPSTLVSSPGSDLREDKVVAIVIENN